MKSAKIRILAAVVFGGLFLFLDMALAQTWTASTNAPNQNWFAVASSADGAKLVAVVRGGGIYTWPCLDLMDSVGVTHETCFS